MVVVAVAVVEVLVVQVAHSVEVEPLQGQSVVPALERRPGLVLVHPAVDSLAV